MATLHIMEPCWVRATRIAGSFTRSPIRTARSTSGKTGPTPLHYFGSANRLLVAQDFSRDEQHDFTIRKEILWESTTATISEITAKEIEFIRRHRSNEPEIEYNRSPRLKTTKPLT
jgi:hypothetical protein